MEYEKINLNPQVEEISSCGCKEKKTKDCKCKKIDLKSQCGTPEYFQVNNYFSELIHEWEKEAARYNLGIQELENIEYKTEETEEGAILTKVVFTYRKGHELITREFCCAPQGPKGEDGRDGRDGATGPIGPRGEQGPAPHLTRVILNWVDNCEDEGGTFDPDPNYPNSYYLNLKLKRPDVFEELSNILNQINDQLTQYYAKKSDLLNYVTNARFNETVSDLLNRISSAGAEYRLEYNEPWLYLTKDGRTVSSVKINVSSSGTIPKTLYTGQFIVFKLGSKNNPAGDYQIIGSNWESKGWSLSLPDQNTDDTSVNNDYVWMAQCYVDNGSYGTWSYSRLSGEDGEDGKDSEGREFIYRQTETGTNPGKPQLRINSQGKPYADNWMDHPEGVSETNRWEWMSFSTKMDSNWSEFTYPILWSHYGKNGHDGDGVEYIFHLTENETPLQGLWNPVNWDNQYPEASQTSEYRGPEGYRWTDNPDQVTEQFPIQWVSKRKRVDGVWRPFSTPTIWNRYVTSSSAESNIIINVTPQLVTYTQGSTAQKTIYVSVYYGTRQLTINNITQNDTDLTITRDSDSKTVSFVYTASASSETSFKVYFKINDSDENFSSRMFRIETAEIPSATSGDSPIVYEMIPSSNVITFNVDNDTLATTNITFDVYKIQGSSRTKLTSGYTITYTKSWTSGETNCTNGINVSSLHTSTRWLVNGDYLTVTLKVDNETWAIAKIPVIKNSQTFTSPYLIRNRGAWEQGEQYYNYTLGEPTTEDPNPDVLYIDVVSNDNLTVDENGDLTNSELSYYMPKVRKPSTNSFNNAEWEESYSLNFAFIQTLIAGVISAKSVQTNELLVTTQNDTKVVAGMTSGNKLNDDEGEHSVRIWSGTITSKDNTNQLKTDITNAPFRVYQDGKVVANDVWYEQLKIDENYIISAEDVVKLNHRIKYLCTTDKTPYIEVKGDQNSLQIINANSQRVSKYTCKPNSMYAIVGLSDNLIGVYELSDPNPKEITPSYSGYTTIEYGNGLNLGDLKISSRPDESKIDSGAIDVEFNEPATIKINVVSGENVYVYTPITFECEIENNGTQNEQIVNALPNCRLRGYGFIQGNTSDNNNNFTIQDLELELDVSTIPFEQNPFKNQQGYSVKFVVSNVVRVDIEQILYKYNIVVNNIMSSGAMISDGRIVGELINGTVTNYENIPIIYSEQQGNSTIYRVVQKKANSISTGSLPSYSDLQEAKVNAYVQEAQINP